MGRSGKRLALGARVVGVLLAVSAVVVLLGILGSRQNDIARTLIYDSDGSRGGSFIRDPSSRPDAFESDLMNAVEAGPLFKSARAVIAEQRDVNHADSFTIEWTGTVSLDSPVYALVSNPFSAKDANSFARIAIGDFLIRPEVPGPCCSVSFDRLFVRSTSATTAEVEVDGVTTDPLADARGGVTISVYPAVTVESTTSLRIQLQDLAVLGVDGPTTARSDQSVDIELATNFPRAQPEGTPLPAPADIQRPDVHSSFVRVLVGSRSLDRTIAREARTSFGEASNAVKVRRTFSNLRDTVAFALVAAVPLLYFRRTLRGLSSIDARQHIRITQIVQAALGLVLLLAASRFIGNVVNGIASLGNFRPWTEKLFWPGDFIVFVLIWPVLVQRVRKSVPKYRRTNRLIVLSVVLGVMVGYVALYSWMLSRQQDSTYEFWSDETVRKNAISVGLIAAVVLLAYVVARLLSVRRSVNAAALTGAIVSAFAALSLNDVAEGHLITVRDVLITLSAAVPLATVLVLGMSLIRSKWEQGTTWSAGQRLRLFQSIGVAAVIVLALLPVLWPALYGFQSLRDVARDAMYINSSTGVMLLVARASVFWVMLSLGGHQFGSADYPVIKPIVIAFLLLVYAPNVLSFNVLPVAMIVTYLTAQFVLFRVKAPATVAIQRDGSPVEDRRQHLQQYLAYTRAAEAVEDLRDEAMSEVGKGSKELDVAQSAIGQAEAALMRMQADLPTGAPGGARTWSFGALPEVPWKTALIGGAASVLLTSPWLASTWIDILRTASRGTGPFNVVVPLVLSVLNAGVPGVVLGYCYPFIRGSTGLAKSTVTLVALALPLAVSFVLRRGELVGAVTDRSDLSWRSLLLAMARLAIALLPLGLAADAWILRRAEVQGGLRKTHNLRALVAWLSSIGTAIAGVAASVIVSGFTAALASLGLVTTPPAQPSGQSTVEAQANAQAAGTGDSAGATSATTTATTTAASTATTTAP